MVSFSLPLADDASLQATGYDGDQRVLQQRHFLGAALLAGFNDTYDRMDNRLTEERLHMPATKRSDAFTMDSRYRLLDQKRDIPQGGGIPAEERLWNLDGAGNWATLSISVNGGAPTVLTQGMDVLNSYTSFGGVAQADDLNGNRTNDGTLIYKWDFLNRLRVVKRASDGAKIASYLHDAWGANGMRNGSGRRIRKEIFLLPIQPQMLTAEEGEEAGPAGLSQAIAFRNQTRFLYDGWRVIEERNFQDRVVQQYVDGGWLDEHLAMDQYNADGVTLKRSLFYHENSQGWIHALTNNLGAVVERYTYDAYGKPTFLDAAGAPLANQKKSAFGNPYLREGYFDPESQTGCVRHRTMSYAQGRWISRDPIGLWGDGVGLGNGYAYVGGWAVNAWDPYGLGFGDDLFAGMMGAALGYSGYEVTEADVGDMQAFLGGTAGEAYRAGNQELPSTLTAYGKGVKEGAEGIGRALIHPIDTLQGLWEFGQLTPQQLRCLFGTQFDQFMNASPQEQARMLGNLGGSATGLKVLSMAAAKLPPVVSWRTALNAEQAANLARFESKLPAGAGPTRIYELPGGGRAFQADVPGRVPGSMAVYEKQVSATGKTLQFTKTTVDPAGNIVHVKDKITGVVLP